MSQEETEEDSECPLCLEELDPTDKGFQACQCGYQVCLWCWHKLNEQSGKCPACRAPYKEGGYQFTAPEPEQLQALQRAISEKKKEKKQQKEKKASQDATDRESLRDVRVLQRNLVVVVGLPPSIAREETLKKKDYFGKHGKVVKVAIHRKKIPNTANYILSAYVTYRHASMASTAIRAIHGSQIENKVLRATFGTTKYCSFFLRNVTCTNPSCLYLHEMASPDDSFSKEDMMAAGNFGGLNFPNPHGNTNHNPNPSSHFGQPPVHHAAAPPGLAKPPVAPIGPGPVGQQAPIGRSDSASRRAPPPGFGAPPPGFAAAVAKPVDGAPSASPVPPSPSSSDSHVTESLAASAQMDLSLNSEKQLAPTAAAKPIPLGVVLGLGLRLKQPDTFPFLLASLSDDPLLQSKWDFKTFSLELRVKDEKVDPNDVNWPWRRKTSRFSFF